MFAFWLLALTIMLCYIAATDWGFTPVKRFDGRRPHPVRETVPVMTARMLIGLLRPVVARDKHSRLICLL